MMKIVSVELDERVVVTRRGLPLRALGPGRQLLWGFGLTARAWSTIPLVFDMPPELRSVLPTDWFSEITIGVHERGVLWRDCRPRPLPRSRYPPLLALLGGRRHAPRAGLSVLDAMPELSKELANAIPKDQ